MSDDAPPEREGWRDFDADAEWTGDTPYPRDAGDDALDGAVEDEEGGEVAAGEFGSGGAGDLIERVAARLDEAELGIGDLSLERRGDTVVLRGTAPTAADRALAGDLARGVAGVRHVDNEIAADADPADPADAD